MCDYQHVQCKYWSLIVVLSRFLSRFRLIIIPYTQFFQYFSSVTSLNGVSTFSIFTFPTRFAHRLQESPSQPNSDLITHGLHQSEGDMSQSSPT
jgi:hypothetical protein